MHSVAELSPLSIKKSLQQNLLDNADHKFYRLVAFHVTQTYLTTKDNINYFLL